MAARHLGMSRNKLGQVAPLLALAVIAAGPATGHFGMLIPSDPMISNEDPRTIGLELSFSHPFEATGMDLARPEAFGVFRDGETTDLLDALSETSVLDGAAWSATFTPERPGTHVFYMEPQPYWEPAEDVFIIHYTKTYVSAFGDETDWDAELGHATEIVPLTRPFGLWEGNVFQGIVKVDGEPVPFAEVEVERYNRDGTIETPSDLMITQVVKAGASGVFTYVPPRPGWWGFAALTTADYQLQHEGTDKDVELGAVLWAHFEEWPSE